MSPRPARRLRRAPAVPQHVRHGRIVREYGRRLEELAIEVFAEGPLPAWYRSIRPATPAEDADGVDLWIVTSRGTAAVQIKPSAERARRFRERHPDAAIGVAVLHPKMMRPGQIRGRVLRAAIDALTARGAM